MRPAPLTKKQRAVLDLLARPFHEGVVNEGEVIDYLWPLVRRPRGVVNALVSKGLVRLGDYLDEEVGYEVHLTDAGRREVVA